MPLSSGKNDSGKNDNVKGETMRFDLLIKGGEVVDPGGGRSGRLDVACDQTQPHRRGRCGHPGRDGLSRGGRRRPVRDARACRSAYARQLRLRLLRHPPRPDRGPQRGDDLARRRLIRRIQFPRLPGVRDRELPGAHICPAQHFVDRSDCEDMGAGQPGLLRRGSLLPDHRPEPGRAAGRQGPDRPTHHQRPGPRAAAQSPRSGRPL